MQLLYMPIENNVIPWWMKWWCLIMWCDENENHRFIWISVNGISGKVSRYCTEHIDANLRQLKILITRAHTSICILYRTVLSCVSLAYPICWALNMVRKSYPYFVTIPCHTIIDVKSSSCFKKIINNVQLTGWSVD